MTSTKGIIYEGQTSLNVSIMKFCKKDDDDDDDDELFLWYG